MISKSIEKKIARKQKRCQYLITEETKIACTDQPTKNLAICNAGLSTGLKEEQLLDHIQKWAQICEIVMLPGKSYCFVKCLCEKDAEAVYAGMHGKTKLGQNDGVLYLSYTVDMPAVENVWKDDCPPGLILIEEFVNEMEELQLLNAIDWQSTDGETGSTLKHRQVKHYGYEFLYGTNSIDVDKPLDQKIPSACDFLWPRLQTRCTDLNFHSPDQLTVNKYASGQGIPPHVDTHSAFTDVILSLSLGSNVTMEFRNPDTKQHVNIHLPKRSLLIMSNESRYAWTHGITPKHTDIVRSKNGGLTVCRRSTRISFTFRCLNESECQCNFPTLCDTYKRKQSHQTENPAKLEMENVHKVYDEIANHFSETRHSPWPEVEKFVQSFDSGGQILVDIGCGNGKYLTVNDNVFKIGCDRSQSLLNVCQTKRLNVFQCDCLCVPLRNDSVDGCISIAVIHHLATEKRRLQAIAEMARILVSGGRALIYVWAKNQQLKNTKSSYLRQNKRNNKLNADNEPSSDNVEYIDGLPVHTNRTQFVHQDVLVPWKLKDNRSGECKETFLRFYHVFDEGELERLCQQIANVRLLRSYYDQGNWCVEFQKH